MASFFKPLFLFFLQVLILSSLQAEAGESRFFNKFKRYIDPKVSISASPSPAIAEPEMAPTPATSEPEIISSPVVAPTVAPTPAPTYSESEYGHGLYGQESSQFNTKTPASTTTTKFEDELDLTEELSGQSFETGYPKTNLYSNNGNPNNYNYNNNNGYGSSYNNDNGYTTNYNSNGYVNNYNGNGNGNGGGYNNYYNSNGYQTEKQGMSDTRFLENGKYYVDVQNENNLNGYQGYYGNNKFPNGINSMGEYEKQEEPVP